MKHLLLTRREVVNLVMWAIFSIVSIFFTFNYVSLIWWWQFVLAGILMLIISWLVVMTVNACVFNWLFKKYFDRVFKDEK
jgi:hypothetical protein